MLKAHKKRLFPESCVRYSQQNPKACGTHVVSSFTRKSKPRLCWSLWRGLNETSPIFKQIWSDSWFWDETFQNHSLARPGEKSQWQPGHWEKHWSWENEHNASGTPNVEHCSEKLYWGQWWDTLWNADNMRCLRGWGAPIMAFREHLTPFLQVLPVHTGE